jgi:hypothetical protein
MNSAARRSAAILALTAASATAAAAPPAPQGDLATLAQRTYFETCLSAMNGSLDLSNAAEVARTGLRRAPAELEKKMTHPRYGQPMVAGTAVGPNVVSMSVYPASSLCTVMLQGPDRESGFAAIRRKIHSSPLGFKPDPEQSKSQGDFQVEAFKVALDDGTSFRAVLMKPPQDDPDPALLATIGRTKD